MISAQLQHPKEADLSGFPIILQHQHRVHMVAVMWGEADYSPLRGCGAKATQLRLVQLYTHSLDQNPTLDIKQPSDFFFPKHQDVFQNNEISALNKVF